MYTELKAYINKKFNECESDTEKYNLLETFGETLELTYAIDDGIFDYIDYLRYNKIEGECY